MSEPGGKADGVFDWADFRFVPKADIGYSMTTPTIARHRLPRRITPAGPLGVADQGNDPSTVRPGMVR